MASSSNVKSGSPSSASSTDQPKRQRKDYGYDMSDKEKYALSIVQQAARACRVIGEDIKSGKGATGETLRACTILAGTAASGLFGPEKPQGQ